MDNLAIYRRMFAPFMGEARASSLKHLNFTPAEARRLGLRIGDSYEAKWPGVHGKQPRFKFVVRAVQVRAAVTDGQILGGYASNASRIANVVAPFDKAVITTDGAFTVNDHIERILEVVAGTGANQIRGIADNTATKLSVAERSGLGRLDANQTADALATLLDATSDVAIYDPAEVVPTSGDTTLVVGAAIGIVDSGIVTLIVERGLVQLNLNGAGAGQAATPLGLICPSAVAGVARGITTAGITAAEAAYSFGRSIHAYSGAAAKRLCFINGRYPLSV